MISASYACVSVRASHGLASRQSPWIAADYSSTSSSSADLFFLSSFLSFLFSALAFSARAFCCCCLVFAADCAAFGWFGCAAASEAPGKGAAAAAAA